MLFDLSIFKVVFTIVILLLLSGCGYSNYDECLLGEMKGQELHMFGTVRKVCERKFPFEKKLSVSTDELKLNWITDDEVDGRIIVSVARNTTDYKLTSVDLLFSQKDCGQSDESDYTVSATAPFNEKATAFVRYPKANNLRCMKTDTVYGIID